MLCASPGYLATHGTPTHPRDMAHHQVLAYSYWSGGHWRFRGPEGDVAVRVNPRIRTNSGDTCRAAALEGPGHRAANRTSSSGPTSSAGAWSN